MKNDTEKLEELTAKLNNSISKLEENFKGVDNYYAILNDGNIWNGEAQSGCIAKYKEVSKQYPDIISSLRNYASSLENVSATYEVFESDTMNIVDTKF